jgi:hypothetical protein
VYKCVVGGVLVYLCCCVGGVCVCIGILEMWGQVQAVMLTLLSFSLWVHSAHSSSENDSALDT